MYELPQSKSRAAFAHVQLRSVQSSKIAVRSLIFINFKQSFGD